jgi:hypothetical protein
MPLYCASKSALTENPTFFGNDAAIPTAHTPDF